MMSASPQGSPEAVPPLRLSVLDQSPIAEGSTGAQALERTLELAALADRLGFHRFWVAEHHSTPMLAGAAPEALIGPIAATTDRIRVGSGGVMSWPPAWSIRCASGHERVPAPDAPGQSAAAHSAPAALMTLRPAGSPRRR
jgi:hypothetical protein